MPDDRTWPDFTRIMGHKMALTSTSPRLRDPSLLTRPVATLIPQPLRLSCAQLSRRLHRWRLQRLVKHYEICAAIERDQAQQAIQNAAWFQKQAAFARHALG